MRSLRRLLALVLTLCAPAAVAQGVTELPGSVPDIPEVDISPGGTRATPIAIPSFVGTTQDLAGLGAEIAGVITNDLRNSAVFAPLDPTQFAQDSNSLVAQVNFEAWRAVRAEFVVAGTLVPAPEGVRLEFRLWETASQQQQTGFAITSSRADWRRMAHIAADQIYKRITGDEGYFNTRVAYVAERGPPTNRTKILMIMDQDGANRRELTRGQFLVLTPRFAPQNPNLLTYMAFANNRPRVYRLALDSGRQDLLGNFPGMTFSPRFSPDGRQVALSQALNGDTDLFAYDLATGRARQLTRGPGLDTSPSFSPDGGRIVFESDRGGSQQLYVMGADGASPTRISFGRGRYASPVWSPRGDLIAFTRMSGGQFHIGVMRPDGSGERTLVGPTFHVEGPTWAPNGRALMYFKDQGNRSRIYATDIVVGGERLIETGGDASDPAWSPVNDSF